MPPDPVEVTVPAAFTRDGKRHQHMASTYFELTDGFEAPVAEHRNPGSVGDPLYAVWARTTC